MGSLDARLRSLQKGIGMKHALIISTALLSAAPAFASEGEGGANPFAGDVGTAIWTVVIFAFVLLVLGKFAWGPILEGLQSREDFIADSLAKAKEDREAAESRLREYEEKLNSARAEATAIVEEGKRDAEEVRRTIEEQSKASADEMIERARREIRIAQETAVKELYEGGTRLSVEIASQVLGREIDAGEHQRLIAEAIERLDIY